jgi:8-oxo-dGTP pyrophosphatase MutT (NUDIX family)
MTVRIEPGEGEGSARPGLRRAVPAEPAEPPVADDAPAIRMPRSIRPGVAVVLQDAAGRLLLHRRRPGGGWAPPSGAVEPGEDLVAALHREILEETALTATVEGVVGVYSDPAYMIVAYPDGRVVHFVTTLFRCRVSGGTLAGNDEGLDWGWYSRDALPDDRTAYARVWLADALSEAGVVVR